MVLFFEYHVICINEDHTKYILSPGDSFFICNPSKILLLVLLLYHDFVRLFYRTLYRIFYGTFMTYATNCFAVSDTGIFYSFGYVQIIILLIQNFILWPFWAVVFHYKFWNFLIIQVNIYLSNFL